MDGERGNQAIRESTRAEARLRAILEVIPDLIMVLDAAGTYRDVYTGEPELLARPVPELIGRSIHDVLPASLARAAQAVIDRALATGTLQQFEYALETGGVERWFSARVVALDAAEDPCVVWVSRDMTERREAETRRRRAEDALREANEDLERRVRDRTADLVAVNERLERENAERRRAEKIQYGHKKVLERLAAGASLEEVLALLVTVSEDVYPELLCSVLLLDADGEHLRHGAAPSLPDFYNRAIDGMAIGPRAGSCGTAAFTRRRVIVQDILSHPYWVEFRDLGRRADVRACWSEPIFSSEGEILGTFAIYYRRPCAPDEGVLEFINGAACMAGIAIEHKRAEAELRDSQARLRMADRLASLGTLTAGLGHDMNNILFPLRCRLDAFDWRRLPGQQRDLLESASDTVRQLQQLCNGLRLFAVDPEDARASVERTDLASWWEQIRPLMTRMVPAAVKIEVDLPADLPPVAVAAHRLTQAVLNLLVNAGEAMPDGGVVRIGGAVADGGRRVALKVIDDGVGMTDDVKHRAFDPFFTTKRRSLSTGLGLSLVLGLVRLSHGTIDLVSAPGRGTTATLTFPAALDPAGARRAHAGGERASVSLRDGRTAAWLVDVLESAGYEVRTGERPGEESRLWVTEPTAANLDAARAFAGPGRRIIALGPAEPAWTLLGAIAVEDVSNLEAIKSAVGEAAAAES